MGTVIMSGIVPLLKAPVIPASTLAVGSTVKLMENGSPAEYLVVNQGIPSGSSLYDASCDGTWLLRKDCCENQQWHSSDKNDYAKSTVNSYLTDTFFNRLGANEKAAIRQVKIPYRPGSGYGKNVNTGTNGLIAKVFLLSATECSFDNNFMPTAEGAELMYFKGCADDSPDSKRVANLDGSAVDWWLRSPFCSSSSAAANAFSVARDGNRVGNRCTYSSALRPALILPSTAVFDKATLILKGA